MSKPIKKFRDPIHKRRDVDVDDLTHALDRAREAPLLPNDYEKLHAAVETLAFLQVELAAQGASIARLRRLIFGRFSTEKTSAILGGAASSSGEEKSAASSNDSEKSAEPAVSGDASPPSPSEGTEPASNEKRKGHGRNPASSYRGADKVLVPHPTMQRGDSCPCCPKGTVYPLGTPSTVVRIVGMAPLSATVYEREQLRCGSCGEVFTAPSPEDVGEEKYDETAAGMVALLKYGAGLPFNRIEKLQSGMGIPLPAATQWDLVEGAAAQVAPAYAELIRQAAQGEVVHNDDTKMRVLSLIGEKRKDVVEDKAAGDRTGVHTTGIVSKNGDHEIALFFTGWKHAGENLTDILKQRAAELPPPIHMSDGLVYNKPRTEPTVTANCTVHARRNFVEILDSFPEECRYVIEKLRDVYRHEAETSSMTPEQRLAHHQETSAPLMDALQKWMRAQIDEKRVEPNSSLGAAIKYMLKRWSALTLFLRMPGAPLDNNVCERALKKAILHRKNALFYKTMTGARVGDCFMSLILTAELYGANPFEYLVALLRDFDDVAERPAEWMPWNYVQALQRTGSPQSPPS